jgi:uncharacterized SAM-binding protein YcdF (DUF218 family)
VIGLLGGFLWFTFQVARQETARGSMADGIVALTGGPYRINDAIELLASGRGQRLLITGVAPTVSTTELARLVPERQHWFGCCVDLGYSALNTIGNAVETRQWALDRGFHSLFVVTSSYHMPRAIAEIAHQLPDVALLPFPVIADKLHAEPWWTRGTTVKLMFSEYLKYVVARMRIRFDSAATARTEGAAAASAGVAHAYSSRLKSDTQGG